MERHQAVEKGLYFVHVLHRSFLYCYVLCLGLLGFADAIIARLYPDFFHNLAFFSDPPQFPMAAVGFTLQKFRKPAVPGKRRRFFQAEENSAVIISYKNKLLFLMNPSKSRAIFYNILR